MTVHNKYPYELIDPEDLDPDAMMTWLVAADESTMDHPLTFGAVHLDVDRWLAKARPHPITPEMTSAEYASLKESLRRQGLHQGAKTIFDHTGKAVDGYHRFRAALENRKEGVDVDLPEVSFVRFSSKQEEELYVVTMNLTRRHLTVQQRKQQAEALLRAGHHGTDNWIAELCGITGETVTAVRAELEERPVESGGIEKLPVRLGKNGKMYQQAKTTSKKLKGQKKKVHQDHHTATPVEEEAEPPVAAQFADDFTGWDHIDSEDGELAERLWHRVVEEWWACRYFLPVYASDLVSLIAGIEGIPVDHFGENDHKRKHLIGQVLEKLVGERVLGHVICRVQDKANSKMYVLSPAGWCEPK
jgi:ParB-like chromosome segregation protein Spo0J